MNRVDNKLAHMKFPLILTVFGLTLCSVDASFAASCEQKATALAASQKAQLLSVKAAGKSCKIKLLIKSAKGAPKRKTVVVPK